jgi:AcrR family transcriptional regulator
MPRPLTDSEIESFRSDACAAAIRLFAEKGDDGVTLRALGRELGVSAMTPYRYFDNKADIYEAVVETGFERLSERSLRVADEHTHPLERLRALGRAYIAFGIDEPHAYRIMFQLDRASEQAAEHPKEIALRSCWQTVKETIQLAIDAGLMVGDANTLAHICWVALHGIVTLHLSSRLSLGLSLEDLVEPMMDNFINGSTTRPVRGTA